MIAFLLAFVPGAAAVDVEFCLEFETNFSDADGGEYFWTDNTNQEARGVWLSVYDTGTFTEKYSTHWVSDVDGCATVALQFAHSYRVETSSKAKVNGIEARAYDDDITPATSDIIHYTSYSPGIDTSVTLLLPDTDMRYVMLSVATWAFWRTGTELALPGGSVVNMYNFGSGYSGGVNGLHYPGTAKYKYVIGHEIGHVTAAIRDEGTGPNKDYDADGDGCPEGGSAHVRHSKEFQSAAAVEGWADFYSALLWNYTATSSCTYVNHYTSDYDLDTVKDNDDVPGEVAHTGYMSCEGIPVPGIASYVTARDYLTDVVSGADPMGCGGTTTNRGTELDWLRFWWDMRTDEGIGFDELIDLYDRMNPNSWDANGSTGSTSDDPVNRLDAAAFLSPIGVDAAYNAQKNNGVDH